MTQTREEGAGCQGTRCVLFFCNAYFFEQITNTAATDSTNKSLHRL